MNSKKPVQIFWYPAEERGRMLPPPGPKYYGVFRPKLASDPAEDWSVLIETPTPNEHKYLHEGHLSFLSEQGPVANLRPGTTFYLCEGRWPVAEGVVLREAEEAG